MVVVGVTVPGLEDRVERMKLGSSELMPDLALGSPGGPYSEAQRSVLVACPNQGACHVEWKGKVSKRR